MEKDMDNRQLTQEVFDHLTGKLIPFWSGLKDEENGGFYGYMGQDLKPDKKADKGCILNSRILWFFSNACMFLMEPVANTLADEAGNVALAQRCLDNAEHAYDFMLQHCMDSENGGILWSVTYDGKPADTIKHTYNQAFAVYALASYFDMSGKREAVDMAYELVRLIEDKCTDPEGYLEAFSRDFTPASNEKLSENGVMADRTMNTLLHVFEAYTELLRVTKKRLRQKGEDGPEYIEEYRDRALFTEERLRFMLNLFADRIYNPELHRQEVFFDRDYNSILDLHSYGHDIETSWLIDRGLAVLEDMDCLQKLVPVTRALAMEVFGRAYRDHSLLNECEKGTDDTRRVWWVQAEAVIGFVNLAGKLEREAVACNTMLDMDGVPEAIAAELLTRGADAAALSQKVHEAACDIWEFIRDRLTDPREGSEWFRELDGNGEPVKDRPIVEEWKCPYHNGRMCMEIIRRCS